MKKTFFALAATFLVISPAFAQWPVDPDTNLPVCTATGTQDLPKIVDDASGGAIITWHDNRGIDSDVYAQRVDAYGDTLWTLNGAPICTTAGVQNNPRPAADGTGGAIIAWVDNRNGNYDIYGQRVDAFGDTLWATNGIPICTATGNQDYIKIICDGSEGAFVTWHDNRGSDTDIYAQRIDANGDTLWAANGVPICTATGDQTNPPLVRDDSGGAIIAWVDYRNGNYDIYAQRVDTNGDTLWPADGVPICTAAGSQLNLQIVSDSSGGAIITWFDHRGSDDDIYAQRVDANGDTLWAADGIPICTAAGDQNVPFITADGTGGAIISWKDRRSGNLDIYAQYVDANGDTLWPANGLPICIVSGDQWDPYIVSDGSGGAVIAWKDYRSGVSDIYAQRVNADGNILWLSNGVPISTATASQDNGVLVGDNSGGAIYAWRDTRGSDYDIYTQKVNHNGTLGPVPYITSISDVPNDQGKQVLIFWDRSYLDAPEYQVITYYSIWRRHLGGSKIASIGEEWDGMPPKDLSKLVYRRIERENRASETKTEYWEYLGSVDAHYFEGYAYIAPTLEDSSASGVPYFTFLVSAQTADPFVFWDSAPDSGYSVDNINPAKTQMTAIASGTAKGPVNTVWLTWDQVTTGVDGSPEQGPIQYRIYCDEAPDFTPAPGNLLTTTSDLSYAHTDARIGDSATNLFYLVTAVDGSDNESAISNMVGEFDLSLTNSK